MEKRKTTLLGTGRIIIQYITKCGELVIIENKYDMLRGGIGTRIKQDSFNTLSIQKDGLGVEYDLVGVHSSWLVKNGYDTDELIKAYCDCNKGMRAAIAQYENIVNESRHDDVKINTDGVVNYVGDRYATQFNVNGWLLTFSVEKLSDNPKKVHTELWLGWVHNPISELVTSCFKNVEYENEYPGRYINRMAHEIIYSVLDSIPRRITDYEKKYDKYSYSGMEQIKGTHT